METKQKQYAIIAASIVGIGIAYLSFKSHLRNPIVVVAYNEFKKLNTITKPTLIKFVPRATVFGCNQVALTSSFTFGITKDLIRTSNKSIQGWPEIGLKVINKQEMVEHAS